MPSRLLQPTPVGWCLLGFLFWGAFLLVLEPGNLLRAVALGRELTLGRETVRMLGAALIGVAAMPGVLWLERRYAVEFRSRPANAAWLLMGLVALAGLMNVVSSFAAAWGFQHAWWPDAQSVRRQLVGNWLLMVFALVGLTAIVRLVRDTPAAARAFPREVIVRSGNRTLRVDLATVDWMEAQGNYVALHVGGQMHLLRSTMAAFVKQMDSQRFLRIHRSTVVAMDRLAALRSEADGEISVHLVTGKQLRVSRSYRKAVRARWTGVAAAAAAS